SPACASLGVTSPVARAGSCIAGELGEFTRVETRGNQCGIGSSRIRSGGGTEGEERPKKKAHAHTFLPHGCTPGGKRYFRFLVACRRFDFFAVFFGFSVIANSRRFLAAQLGLLTWRPRAIPKPSEGTFSVMVEPAAM